VAGARRNTFATFSQDELQFSWQSQHFEGFQAGCPVVLRGRRGTLWHSNLFGNVSKVGLCGRRSTFATFSGDALQFSWQAQHFGRVHRHFSWQAQHFRRGVLRVYCKSHWQGCVKWRQGANSVAGVAF
jgi:fluoride ion exporter CrcB/FEX